MIAVLPLEEEWPRTLTCQLERMWEEGSHPQDVQQETPLLEPTMLAPEPRMSQCLELYQVRFCCFNFSIFVMTQWDDENVH